MLVSVLRSAESNPSPSIPGRGRCGTGWSLHHRFSQASLPSPSFQPEHSQATYFNWKKKYDGLLPTEMRRLKQLEDENAKLKRIVADLSLDKEMLQDAIRRKL